MQDRYGQVGAVWSVRGELSRTRAQRGHRWLQAGPVAALHSVGWCCWQNPCMGTTLRPAVSLGTLGHFIPILQSTAKTLQHLSLDPQQPQGPCGTSQPSLQRPWAPLTASSSGSPAVPITCCSWGRALGIAPLLPLTQCQLLAPQLPCTAGASASSSGQAWQAGRRRQFSQAFKGGRASSFPCQAGTRQELSNPPGWTQNAPRGNPSTSCCPKDGLGLSFVTPPAKPRATTKQHRDMRVRSVGQRPAGCERWAGQRAAEGILLLLCQPKPNAPLHPSRLSRLLGWIFFAVWMEEGWRVAVSHAHAHPRAPRAAGSGRSAATLAALAGSFTLIQDLRHADI